MRLHLWHRWRRTRVEVFPLNRFFDRPDGAKVTTCWHVCTTCGDMRDALGRRVDRHYERLGPRLYRALTLDESMAGPRAAPRRERPPEVATAVAAAVASPSPETIGAPPAVGDSS